MKTKILTALLCFVFVNQISSQVVSYYCESCDDWITSFPGAHNYRDTRIGAFGGDTITMRIDSAGIIKDILYWTIEDNLYGGIDTIFNEDTISIVLPADSLYVFNGAYFFVKAHYEDPDPYNEEIISVDAPIWPKLIQFKPTITFDNLSQLLYFETHDSIQNFYTLTDFIIVPDTVYWFKDDILVDSISGASFSPSLEGNYWAKALIEYRLWDSMCDDTVSHYRFTKFSDTLFVSPQNFPTPCIQSVGAITQSATDNITSDGAVFLTINGGVPPFTFLWSNNSDQQDLENVLPGIYSVQISSANSICPTYYLSAQIAVIGDPPVINTDTIYTATIDTCLGFPVLNHYVSGVTNVGNTTVVIWVFVGEEEVAVIATDYTQVTSGEYIASITLSCAKSVETFYYKIFAEESSTANRLFDKNANIKVYPNPVKNALFFSESVAFDVYSLDGKKLFSGNSSYLDVSEYALGIYIIKFTNDSEQNILRFVKE